MINDDSNSTYLNPWSFNNEVNMLYIDQPNPVGFSWDLLKNGTFDHTIDLYLGPITPDNFTNGVPSTNNSLSVGTFPSQYMANTASSTQNAAHAIWHLAQTWFQEFPKYKPKDNAISVFTDWFGGRYGPALAAFFEEQNHRIANQSSDEKREAYAIRLDTLGIVNGCIDLETQESAYLMMANNNTYGIKTFNETDWKEALEIKSNKTVFQELMQYINDPDGCDAVASRCQDQAAEGHPDYTSTNETVNSACSDAADTCLDEADFLSGLNDDRSLYDVAAIDPSPFPPNYFIGYLANAHVQAALGVRVNFTLTNPGIYNKEFTNSGDYTSSAGAGGAGARGRYLQDLGHLLDNGVKIALIYGDRDFVCNWFGGEKSSLALNYTSANAFHAAGYTNISTNSSYVGGQVRQHNNFSFSRVFQAGHQVPAYQPETAYQIFRRAIFGKDIATGTIDTASSAGANYSTQGSATTFEVKNIDPGSPTPQCYILAWDTCTDEQAESVLNGSALVHNYILIGADQSQLLPRAMFSDPVGLVEMGIGGGMTKSTGGKGGAEVVKGRWVVTGTVALLLGGWMVVG